MPTLFIRYFIMNSSLDRYTIRMTKIWNTIVFMQTIKTTKAELPPSDQINKGNEKGSTLFIPDYKIVIGIIISDNMIEINRHLGTENPERICFLDKTYPLWVFL